MFSADTSLVMDALQIAALAALVGGAGGYLLLRRRSAAKGQKARPPSKPADLEDRVRVLERIATDRSADLAEEIESLRQGPNQTNRETA